MTVPPREDDPPIPPAPPPPGGVRIRVVIADDQGMVRSGFSVLLNAQTDIEVVGEAVNGREAIAQAAVLPPDVILMDVRMPVLDGLQATREITAMPSPPKVLVLTTFDLDDYVYEALRSAGAGAGSCSRTPPRASWPTRCGWWRPATPCSPRV